MSTYQKFVNENLPRLCEELLYLSANGSFPDYSSFSCLRRLVKESGIPDEACFNVAQSAIYQNALLYVGNHSKDCDGYKSSFPNQPRPFEEVGKKFFVNSKDEVGISYGEVVILRENNDSVNPYFINNRLLARKSIFWNALRDLTEEERAIHGE